MSITVLINHYCVYGLNDKTQRMSVSPATTLGVSECMVLIWIHDNIVIMWGWVGYFFTAMEELQLINTKFA